MKWGLSAKAASEIPTIRNSANSRAIPYFNRCMVNLQGSMQIHIVKTYIYTTEYSTHYKASIQGGFLHAPRDPLQIGLSGSLANNFCCATRLRRGLLLSLKAGSETFC